MDLKIKKPELKCMDPDNYRKYFRTLCWNGSRRTDKKPSRKFNKKDRLKRLKGSSAFAVCYAPALLANPSHFGVYATVRRTILARCRQLQIATSDFSDDSDSDDAIPPAPVAKIPKITGIGLRTVFALISQARYTDALFCEYSLRALLDVLQGHAPEDLANEPNEIMSNLHSMLVEIASGIGPTGRTEAPSTLTALSSSCMIALAVARGEAELFLGAVTSLIMTAPSLTEQYIQIPINLTKLQRSVQSVIIGPASRNLWLNFGVPHKSLVTSFPVDLPPQLTAGSGELVVRSLVSDGCFLYVFTSKGLLKIGSGYGSSIKQHVYLYKPNFFASDRHGWLGYCRNKMYVRIGRKKSEVHEVDKESLEVKCMIRLDPGQSGTVEPKSAVFTDGNQLGLILLPNNDTLTIKMYDIEQTAAERVQGGKYTLAARRELNVHLLRRRTLILGRPTFDDGLSRRMVDLDSPVAMQLDDNDDDPLMGICGGQDFALLTTSSGKVYYTGKGTSLGYKVPSPHTGRWTLMKETLFNKHDAPNVRKCKVAQVALGHEGVHAILVLDNGTVLFTGIARRGEDGDYNRHRRTPKPTRPKKILRAERHHIVYAACNYGSTALVTRQGELFMFGKDTQHCDENGLVTGLRNEKIVQVALGKAHAIALTNLGDVFSFGINNKGQCGREFGYVKEKPLPNRNNSSKEEARLCAGAHSWSAVYCRVCVMCRECTGFGIECHCATLPTRVPGERCGCGEGDGGCSVCGVCRRCVDSSTPSTAPTKPDQTTTDKKQQQSNEAGQSVGRVPLSDAFGRRNSNSGDVCLSELDLRLLGLGPDPGESEFGGSDVDDSGPGVSGPAGPGPDESGPDESGPSGSDHGEPGHGEPGHGEPGHGEPGHGEPGHSEPGHDEPGHDEPGHDEPGHDEPGNDEPGHDEPGHDEPGYDEPGHDEPGHDEPGHDEPGHDEPGHDEPSHDEPGHDEPGHDEPGHDEPGHGEPGHGGPGPCESVKSAMISGGSDPVGSVTNAPGPCIDAEREASLKVSCLAPARVVVPGGHRIISVACGLHHTILLTEHGEVFTFGSNQWGALGAGDVASHHRLVRVRVPRAAAIAAGSNHSAVLTREGELYTFGSYQKGSLGRVRQEESRLERSPVWYATPGRVPRIGPRYGCQGVWISASGDQTFVQVSQALLNTETLFSSTIIANSKSIIILPNRPEHTFKCITINKSDGSCNAWTGPEQVDFVNTLACLDPLYDVLWCYQPQMRVMKCFNIIAFDSHKLQRCCSNDSEGFSDSEFDYPNYGCMKRLEDFRHVETFEWIGNYDDIETENIVLSDMSVLNQELAIPLTQGCQVTRIHACLHLLGCLDSLTYAHENRPKLVECKRDINISLTVPLVADYLTVTRFENQGGGWGYSGHSIEAIRFMCDNDILLGGVGLYGGRGEYTAKVRLYDLGTEGGDQEGDGEMVFETDDVFYECAPKDKYPLMFETSASIFAGKWYVVTATINGPSSDCGSSGQAMVINDEIGFHFKTSKKSNNGTDVNAGQIPSLLYNLTISDNPMPIRHLDPGEPVIVLSKNVSRKVTVTCFRSLVTILHWSWRTFRDTIMDTNGQIPINYQKLTTMKHQKRLVYIMRAGMRLVKFYIKEIYPQSIRKRNSPDYMSYFEPIADVRSFIQTVMSEQTPTCALLPKKQGRNKTHRVCYVQFALELTNSVLKEAHQTFNDCFYAFFPTPILKWNHLCLMLYNVRDGKVPPAQVRELTATCAAMCLSQSLRDVLQYIVPLTQRQSGLQEMRQSNVKVTEIPTKSATVPRASHSQKPPPVPPRARDVQKVRENTDQTGYLEWHLMDVIPRLLDVVLNPLRKEITQRQCAPTHDHGELQTQDRLSEYCCKLTSRVIAEMSFSALQYNKDDVDSKTPKHMVTASRFMRVTATCNWSTGHGSPDAICFTVDRPGVAIVGACVFIGSGKYDYSLELLHDMRTCLEDANPTHCWVSVEVREGQFTTDDIQNDTVQLKFTRPVLLKDDTRYALRFCCDGARTVSGDCGLPAVTGPDGTTFQFSTCSLSFNGTSLSRGQLPSLIYYRTKWVDRTNDGSGNGVPMGQPQPQPQAQCSRAPVRPRVEADCDRGTARAAAIAVAMQVAERSGALLADVRALAPDDLRRAAPALACSPPINTLLPFALANLEGLQDSKSVISLLEIVRKLLPPVAEINLKMPSNEDALSTTTSQYYTWVESEHPYKQSTVINKRVLFPPQVSWIVLEMDPRSITAQPEDTLTIFAVAGAPKHRCHCSNDAHIADPPFRKRLIQLTSEIGEVEELEETSSDAPCMHYNCTYVSVTPKLSNIYTEWPQRALLVPGNEVIFSLETSSDYLNEYNQSNNEENRFGFRCLVVGYEGTVPSSGQVCEGAGGGSVVSGGGGGPAGASLATLEMELVHLGASCAARLLTPDLDIPPLTQATIVDVQMFAVTLSNATMDDVGLDEIENLMLSRGLELGSPPAVHSVLDGLPLLRCISTERQFLQDFVSGAESTAGGRLAQWLAPGPRVDPTRCELKGPPSPVQPASRISLPILIRDQYGDIVCSPAVKVEVVVQRLEDSILRTNTCVIPERRGSLSDVPYQPTIRDTMWFHAITMMKPYQNYSFEELRYASGVWGGTSNLLECVGPSSRVPAERIIVDVQRDGSYVAIWVPRVAGNYIFRCTLDDYATSQDLKIEVAESGGEEQTAERWLGPSTFRLRRFMADDSAGLRVRAGPSVHADELGRIPSGAYVAIVEEVANKDGTWVRLNKETTQMYAAGYLNVAWCLQYNSHLDRALLAPVEDEDAQDEYASNYEELNEARALLPLWQDDDSSAPSYVTDTSAEDQTLPFLVQSELPNESDDINTPYTFGEPSKRGRLLRNQSTSMPTPRRMPRRNNGNSEDWWPLKHCSSDNVVSALETDILETKDETMASRVAQTGTQTSPESVLEEVVNTHFDAPKRERSSMRPSREHFVRSSRSRCSVSPPVPVRSTPMRKYAVSPAQAECVRAIFAAILWHEGIVHDAIACATFLKFHPQLPKAGASVVTRPPHDTPPPRPQRHSVEVSNAGQYLHINPSTLETLTRSGIEANANRARQSDIDAPIREEEAGASHGHDAGSVGPSVVNVLPPALRAIVALWDVLSDSDQLVVATDKNRQEQFERMDNDSKSNALRKIRDYKYGTVPLTVKCELCDGGSVPPPLAAHMRHAHPGCRRPSVRGYDRTGEYKLADSLPTDDQAAPGCGQLAQDLIGVKIRATLVAYQLWYIYCENCRERALKAIARQRLRAGLEQARLLLPPGIDHYVMRDNAAFLLDLAPLVNSESSSSGWHEAGGRSPPTPPGSVWRPAPPFQCLPALGAAPKENASAHDTARYHSLGRPMPPTVDETPSTSGASSSQNARVPRSVSMGQAGGRDLANAARPPLASIEPDQQETLSGVGSSLLAQPSAALQKLVGGGEWTSEGYSVSAFESPPIDPDIIMRSPVIGFIIAKRDLPACRQKMDASVRINTIRQYAFEALNWLLRSTSQPTSVHDVMWWFCNVLEKFAYIVPQPLSYEDNKENTGKDWSRYPVPTASAAAICPGGRAARGSRAAFHAFLGSVSALAPSLNPASAAALQAVRCYTQHYTQQDRAFLHRSQVFSVISKILSHAEDSAEGSLGALQESSHSYINKQEYIWSCPDVTNWCEISVSSRIAMAGALTDASTETFWESGDEDRNRAKWIQLMYAGPSNLERPHVLCIHVDNSRDTLTKTLMMSFLYSCGSNEMSHMQDIEVDPRSATWVCYTLPRSTSGSVRVRCELRGPEGAVRVRQLRVLGAPTLDPEPRPLAHPLHSLAERDTIRVFRLLTTQVFGKLLEWDQTGSESDEGATAEEAVGDHSDLREHVVGILFAGHQLTSLQQQVMSHIVYAIGCEAARVRDDWETALLCAEAAEREPDYTPGPPLVHHLQDNYCFEMLSLLLALSGSAVGRAHLAERTELLADLLALLHTGSERVQRQVISLLRRMIAEVPPQKMISALNQGRDLTRVSLIDYLVCYVAKAISMQVKVKGVGAASPSTVTMGASVNLSPPSAWFMRGDTTTTHAHLVAKLVTDMAEDKVSASWGHVTRAALVYYVRAVAQIEDYERSPSHCISSSVVWHALASLCICDHHHIELFDGASESNALGGDSESEPPAFCTNHDDGYTLAAIDCLTCGPLCAECDRFLHLKRAARNHQRQICKEEESAVRIDIHEGCGRAKLHWLLLLVDRRTLKALVEFRGLENAGAAPSETEGTAGTCRFCSARSASGLLAIGNVCSDPQCQEHGREACTRVHNCGHVCGGVRNERTCLPCLIGCAAIESLRQDADDMCMICFTDPLQAAPAIQLTCGHVFHLHCCKKVLAAKWVGPRITFSFSQCPICKEDIAHWTLEELLTPIRQLREEVRRKALMRLEYEGLAASGSQGRAQEDPALYAMERYAYYVCHKCGKAYFGGLARCEAENSGWWEPAELVCGACSDVAGARTCPKHGADFLEYKCRYCCSIAVFFCFGTSHFCNACHDDFQRVTNIPRHLLPQCPAGPKGEQLSGTAEECPLHVQHPETGEEFALGCGVCRHAHSF